MKKADSQRERISERRVLRSAAGWYVGREYLDKECNVWLPYSRESGYYPSEQMAREELDKMNEHL